MVKVDVPDKVTPPPEPVPPALLPLIVQLVTVTFVVEGPSRSAAPPPPVEVFPEKVELLMEAVPPTRFCKETAPPVAALFPENAHRLMVRVPMPPELTNSAPPNPPEA